MCNNICFRITSYILIMMLFVLAFCSCNMTDNSVKPSIEDELSSEVETIIQTIQMPEKKLEVKMNEVTVNANVCEYSFEKYDWAYKLTVPYLSDSKLTIAEADSDTVLFYIKVNIKNLSTTEFTSYDYYDWQSSLIYDGKYQYYPYIIADDFAHMSLSPLMSGNIYIVYELPEFIKTDNKSISVDMTIFNQSYTLEVRGENEAEVEKNILELNNPQVIENQGEITFEGISFKKSIYPKNPGYLYSIYDASNGNKFFVAEFTVKNNSELDIHAQDLFDGTITIGNEKYPGSCILGNSDNSDISSSYALDISAKRIAYFIAEIPENVTETGGTATFVIFNEKFTINF